MSASCWYSFHHLNYLTEHVLGDGGCEALRQLGAGGHETANDRISAGFGKTDRLEDGVGKAKATLRHWEEVSVEALVELLREGVCNCGKENRQAPA